MAISLGVYPIFRDIQMISVIWKFREAAKISVQVFMDISLDGEKLGRILMGLYGKQVPKTVRIPRIPKRCASKSLTGWFSMFSKDHVRPFG